MTDTDTMPEPGTIEDARRIVGSHWVEAVLLGADGVVALARLALAEHERAEALARRVAELEARAVRAEAAVARVAIGPCPRPGCAISEFLALLNDTPTTRTAGEE